MNARHTLWAYFATLGALLIVVIAAKWGVTPEPVLRIIDIVAAGLVGILGTFRPRSPEAQQPKPTEESHQ